MNYQRKLSKQGLQFKEPTVGLGNEWHGATCKYIGCYKRGTLKPNHLVLIANLSVFSQTSHGTINTLCVITACKYNVCGGGGGGGSAVSYRMCEHKIEGNGSFLRLE